VKPGQFAKEESRSTGDEMRQIAGYTNMDYKINTDVMKELNTEPIMNFIQTYRANWKCQFLGCPVQEFHFNCCIINQKGKDPLEDPTSGGMTVISPWA
jgi:hypothetical protein